jgi:serine/threonine-protein kinase
MPLSKSRGKDTADFLSDFFRLLKDCVPDVEKTCTEKTDLRGLEAAVKAVTAGGRALILMLDDLDALLDNSRFTVDFFNFLRDLAQQYRVAYVTTTPRRLWGWFTHQGPFSGSSFANIFPGPLPLGPFTKDEARDLITRPSQRAGASLEGDINALEYLAGRFPFFLQVACHLFFELRSQTPNAGDKEIEAVAGRYGELMKDWLNMIWEQDFTQEEREVCRLLVQKERVPNELQEPLSGLADLGYAQQREDGTFRLVPAVWRHFVRRKLSLPHPHKGGFFSVLMNIFHGQPPPRREQ